MCPTGSDPYLSKIEDFFDSNNASVVIKKYNEGYSIYMAEDNSPIARIKVAGSGGVVEVLWWSETKRWDDKGTPMSLDKALRTVAGEMRYR